MRPMPLLLAAIAANTPLLGQANCSAGQPATLATQTPFFGNSLYGHPNYPNSPGPTYTGFTFLFDLTAQVPIDISRIDIDLYDAGGLVQVNPTTTVTSPNQVGATTNVQIYVIPAASWIGNETNPAAWGLLASGTLTVGQPHADSPAVFTPPFNLPAGLWGIAFKVDQTTTGPNPGPLHPMVDPATTIPGTYTNTVLSMVNVQMQRESWTQSLTSPAHTQNLEIHYTTALGSANWSAYGTGCVVPNAPQLTLNARPVIGTTVDFQTANIQPGTSFNLWLFGFSPAPTGFGLGSFGLPGCNLYLQFGSPITTSLGPVVSGTATSQLAIPNDVSFSGLVLYGQSAPMTSGFNAGFFTSNGVCVAIGQF